MAALQDELPGLRGEKQRAFLLDHGNSLAAGARLKLMCDQAVEKNAAGKRMQSAGDNLQQRGFTAGVWPEHGDHLSGFGLEAGGFEREYGRLLGIGCVSVTHLLDAQ